MPVFLYKTKDAQGEYHKGEVETVDEYHAATLLRRKKLIVISLKLKNDNTRAFWDKIFSRISFGDVVVFTRQLATMIQSGLVLSEALDILADQQANARFKKILTGVSSDIKSGLDFAAALEKYPEVFPNLFTKLVRAGQASGKLDTVLLELAANLEKQREFQSRVRGAMIYPVMVICMMLGVMLIMLFFVMPKLTGLYKDSGMELPILTKVMIGTTEFLVSFWWAVLILLVMIGITIKRYIATPDGRLFFDQTLLNMPVAGRIIVLVLMTNFTRTFGLMVASGLTILDSIKMVGDVVGNRVYKDNLAIAYKGVERGLPFSTQLLSMPVFPKIVGQMIKTGEETGKLDEITLKLSDYFESEADNSLKNITTLIEPLILIILGIGVAFLVISIILPIYQLTTSIK